MAAMELLPGTVSGEAYPVGEAVPPRGMDLEPDDEPAPTALPSGSKKSNAGGGAVLPNAVVAREFIYGKPSDLEGCKQLGFHLGCAALAAAVVRRALACDSCARQGHTQSTATPCTSLRCTAESLCAPCV